MLSGNMLSATKLLQSLGKKRCTCAVNAMGYFLSSRSDTTKIIARRAKKKDYEKFGTVCQRRWD